jgi:hypothetical protein
MMTYRLNRETFDFFAYTPNIITQDNLPPKTHHPSRGLNAKYNFLYDKRSSYIGSSEVAGLAMRVRFYDPELGALAR